MQERVLDLFTVSHPVGQHVKSTIVQPGIASEVSMMCHGVESGYCLPCSAQPYSQGSHMRSNKCVIVGLNERVKNKRHDDDRRGTERKACCSPLWQPGCAQQKRKSTASKILCTGKGGLFSALLFGSLDVSNRTEYGLLLKSCVHGRTFQCLPFWQFRHKHRNRTGQGLKWKSTVGKKWDMLGMLVSCVYLH
eukprot:scaffold25390_cov18-Tisochrysis_lutea.AAC.1